ncbi:hypothetical protein [[Clostridium] colinum]|uniref:hypothetical protein n=1 Tax=[Clostridium] colinum TaxID=36835 RepID=UPI00202436DB|nr:hypothetical protein [[Clostridium] colinum]
MNCKYHNNIKATNTCSICGEWLCENCVLHIDGRIYCKDCLKNKVKKEENLNNITSHKYTYNKPKSSFLTFMLSICFPGSAQMYLGYTKRGLIILVVWLLGFYVTTFSPLILITYIFALFDAFKLKSNLENNIYVEDNVSDIKNFILENKFFIFILTIIIIVPIAFDIIFELIDEFFDMSEDILYNIHLHSLDKLMYLSFGILLGFLLNIIINKFKNKKNNNN